MTGIFCDETAGIFHDGTERRWGDREIARWEMRR
jgi:hypothetical protein